MNDEGKKDSCFNCSNFLLCFMRRGVEDLIRGTNMINIDGNVRPGKYADIYETLSSTCTEYKQVKADD